MGDGLVKGKLTPREFWSVICGGRGQRGCLGRGGEA